MVALNPPGTQGPANPVPVFIPTNWVVGSGKSSCARRSAFATCPTDATADAMAARPRKTVERQRGIMTLLRCPSIPLRNETAVYPAGTSGRKCRGVVRVGKFVLDRSQAEAGGVFFALTPRALALRFAASYGP